ncbi:MAG: hypothetical protein QX198_11315 [Methylococcaceae bacterium]
MPIINVYQCLETSESHVEDVVYAHITALQKSGKEKMQSGIYGISQ